MTPDAPTGGPAPRLAATLRVRLLAGEVLVAESTDPALWQHTLAAISGLAAPPGGGGRPPPAAPAPAAADRAAHLDALCTQLAIGRDQVVAACEPSLEPPYLHLDMKAWEEFKRNTGARGTESVAPIVLATTLLALWFKAAGLAAATVPLGQKVLGTIGLRDKNPNRGLRNCEWLQHRADAVRLNPTRHSQAVAVARAYCSGRPVGGE